MTPAPFRSPLSDQNGFSPRSEFRPFDLAEAESTLGASFRTAALRRGAAIALVDGDVRITYSELLRRAEGIASDLVSRHGAQSGIVAICLPSGLPVVEAMLGALLGGFAYFCIDPLLPKAQIDALLEAAAPLATVGDLNPRPNRDPSRRSAIDTSGPGGIAALYATSGSTGEPKLAMLPHRAVLFDIGRQTNDLFLGPDDRFDSLFSSAFSASLATIFGALLNGAELHLCDPRQEFTELLTWMEHHAITVSTMTVSMLRHLCLPGHQMKSGRGLACPRLRLLSVGGETLSARDVLAFRSVFSRSCVLQNAMASTETRTYAQFFMPFSIAVEDPVPIGWTVAGKTICLVDESGASVPQGADGEIVVRSRFVATGYLNHSLGPPRNFEADAAGTILYRTGDRGRFRPDGALVFLGRTDSQVKIRGHRVELSAVTNAIKSHPSIADAAVLKSKGSGGNDRLVAYVALLNDATLTERSLRDFLRPRLASSAVPSEFLFLPELPLNTNGKLDLRSLPKLAIAVEAAPSSSSLVTVAILREIWQEVLQRSDFSPEDRFEDLGGDSLGAVCVAVAVADRFGCRLPSDSMPQDTSLLELAARVDRLATADSPHHRPIVFHTEGEGSPFFFIPGMVGSVHEFGSLAAAVAPRYPAYGLLSPAATGDAISIEAIAAQYAEAVRSVAHPSGRVILVGHSIGGTIAFEVARQLRKAGDLDPLPIVIDMPAINAPGLRPASTSRQLVEMARNLPARAAYELWQFQPQRSLLRVRGHLDRVGRFLQAREDTGVDPRLYCGTTSLPATYQAHLDALYRALMEYTPQRYEGKVVLLRARVPTLNRMSDPRMGWQHVASGGVEVHSIPGVHGACLAKRYAGQLARVLRSCAARFEAAPAERQTAHAHAPHSPTQCLPIRQSEGVRGTRTGAEIHEQADSKGEAASLINQQP